MEIKKQTVADDLVNLITNVGTARDKTAYSTFTCGIKIDRELANVMYRYEWMSKIVDIYPYEMTREGRTWESEELDDKRIKDLTDEYERVCFMRQVRKAITWGRLYGGSVALISVDGHGDASIPLDVTKIRKGQLRWIKVLDRWRVFPYQYTYAHGFYDEPEFYQIAETAQRVHKSRLVKFVGQELPYWETIKEQWYGASVFERVFQTFKDVAGINNGIAALVAEANVDVMKIAGLAEMLAQDKDDKVKTRFELMALMKAINNMLLLDEGDEYVRNQMTFAGIAQVQIQVMHLLAAACDIPATRLLGQAPQGMNATGESDMRNFYDRMKDEQQTITPQVNYLDQVIVRSLLGDYPEGLSWEWNPLWQMSEKEQAEIRTADSQTLLNLQGLDVPGHVLLRDARERGIVLNLTDEHIDEIEKESELDEEDGELEGLLGGEKDKDEDRNAE